MVAATTRMIRYNKRTECSETAYQVKVTSAGMLMCYACYSTGFFIMNVTFKQVIKRAKRIAWTLIVCSTGCNIFRIYAGSKSLTIRRVSFSYGSGMSAPSKRVIFPFLDDDAVRRHWLLSSTALYRVWHQFDESLESIRRFDIFIWVTQISRTLAEMNTESLNREDVRRPVGLVKAVSVALFMTKATSTDRGNLAPVVIPCKTY